MTKLQIAAIINAMDEHKATKKLSTTVLALLEEFSAKSNRDTVKRTITFERDGAEYKWCARHEVYEPITNFKGKDQSCSLAVKHWRALSKEIKTLNEKLTVAALDGEPTKEIAEALKSAQETRGGRYDFAANELQYPDLEGYEYNTSLFIKDGEEEEL